MIFTMGVKSAWNDDYMNKLMVQVVGIFPMRESIFSTEVDRQFRPVTVRQQQAEPGDRIEAKQTPLSQTSPIRKAVSMIKKPRMSKTIELFGIARTACGS